jgi:uncharacterized membrane protein (DUF373 family)
VSRDATRRTSADEHHTGAQSQISSGVDVALSFTEDFLYASVALVLVGGAVALLFDAAFKLVDNVGKDVADAIKISLDRLLLVFILVELLGAVRATIREHRLVAEPFLIVGMIASIKEIVIIAVDAKKRFGQGEFFTDAMIEVGALGGLLVALGVTVFLLRRKEREPAE